MLKFKISIDMMVNLNVFTKYTNPIMIYFRFRLNYLPQIFHFDLDFKSHFGRYLLCSVLIPQQKRNRVVHSSTPIVNSIES